MTPPVIVLGAGPAGMSAALWLSDLGVPFRWLEAHERAGGTLLRVGNPVDDLLGFPAMPGRELASTLATYCENHGLAPELNVGVERVETADGWVQLRSGSAAVEAQCLLLCTGTRPRTLGIDAESTHYGRGVEISVTQRRMHYAGADTVVVGGGDAALEGALLLAPHARSVTIVHRGSSFGGQPRFVERLAEHENVRFRLGAQIAAIHTGDEAVTGVELDVGEQIPCSGVFVRIGVDPNVPVGLEMIRGADGYVATDPRGRTSLPQVFAAGDVASRDHQSVSWAIGSSGRAVRAIYDSLAHIL